MPEANMLNYKKKKESAQCCQIVICSDSGTLQLLFNNTESAAKQK
jgi:hypothetical protein